MRILCSLLVVGLTFVAEAGLQGNDVKVTVDEIDIGRVYYDGDHSPKLLGSRQRRPWVKIVAKYELATVKKRSTNSRSNQGSRDDKWIDELVIDWQVVIPCKGQGGKPSEEKSVLLSRSVMYENVEAEGTHYAVVFIDPRTYERYKDEMVKDGDFFVKLRITVQGKTRAQAYQNGRHFNPGPKLPKTFFPRSQSDSWFTSESARVAKGGLITRLESPWAWSDSGTFDFAVPSQGRE